MCAIAERSADRKQLVFSAFDPVKGRGRELAELKTDATADYEWDLSPDGARIAILKIREGRIQILSLNGRAPQEITVTGWNRLTTVVWMANGKGLFVSSLKEQGSVLLDVDLQGNAHVLWEHHGQREHLWLAVSRRPPPCDVRLDHEYQHLDAGKLLRIKGTRVPVECFARNSAIKS